MSRPTFSGPCGGGIYDAGPAVPINSVTVSLAVALSQTTGGHTFTTTGSVNRTFTRIAVPAGSFIGASDLFNALKSAGSNHFIIHKQGCCGSAWAALFLDSNFVESSGTAIECYIPMTYAATGSPGCSNTLNPPSNTGEYFWFYNFYGSLLDATLTSFQCLTSGLLIPNNASSCNLVTVSSSASPDISLAGVPLSSVAGTYTDNRSGPWSGVDGTVDLSVTLA